MLTMCLLFFIMFGLSGTYARPDFEFDKSITKLAFGSCSKPYKNLEIFSAISDYSPDAFLWTGDAVYARTWRGNDLSQLRKRFGEMKASSLYQKLLKKNPKVLGVYDDHDYCGNDMGKWCPNIEEAKELFLGFLGAPKNDPRRNRPGMYSSNTFGPPGRRISVIFLDTRTFRDDHCIPAIFMASLTRLITQNYMLCGNYAARGDILGKEQFRWLDMTLKESDADVHLIVSSIQVFTSNALVESWGHFPTELAKLVYVLRKRRPKNLVFISGDVHHGEFIGKDGRLVEVTSSGLTHSLQGAFHSFFSTHMARYYRSHRLDPDGVSFDRNFGTIEVDWGAKNGPELTLDIRDVAGKPILTHKLESRSFGKWEEGIPKIPPLDWGLPLYGVLTFLPIYGPVTLLYIVKRLWIYCTYHGRPQTPTSKPFKQM